MGIGQTAFNTIVAAFPENVVQLRYAGLEPDLAGTIASAFCSGMERVRAQTDEGLVNGADGNVRYLTSAEPSAWADGINGQVVEILFYGESEWERFRVASRKPLQGAVRLNLLAEFEEA